AASVRIARRSAREPRQGSRVPHARRRLHERHARCVHRAQVRGGAAFPHDDAPDRVRDVLLGLSPGTATWKRGGSPAPFSLAPASGTALVSGPRADHNLWGFLASISLNRLIFP